MPACFRSFLSIRPLHKITRRKCGASDERSRIGIILSDSRTVAVGIHNRAARLENGWILRGHDVRAEIEFTRGDADNGDQKRSCEPYHHNLEVSGAVRRI